MDKKLRVLLVDDHEIVRIGLTTLLNRHFEVVGEASSGEEGVRLALALKPDVIVMDIRMPGIGGIEACRRIIAAWPTAKIIVLTSYAEDELLYEAIDAGAVGYVLKRIGSDELVKAIEVIGRGESLLDSALTANVFARLKDSNRRSTAAAFRCLTDQETRILALIAEGRTNREIAETLSLSEKTVRNYVSSIFQKLGVEHRTQAAAYALKHRISDHV